MTAAARSPMCRVRATASMRAWTARRNADSMSAVMLSGSVPVCGGTVA